MHVCGLTGGPKCYVRSLFCSLGVSSSEFIANTNGDCNADSKGYLCMVGSCLECYMYQSETFPCIHYYSLSRYEIQVCLARYEVRVTLMSYHEHDNKGLNQDGVNGKLCFTDRSSHKRCHLNCPPLETYHEQPWYPKFGEEPPFPQALPRPAIPGLLVEVAQASVGYDHQGSSHVGCYQRNSKWPSKTSAATELVRVRRSCHRVAPKVSGYRKYYVQVASLASATPSVAYARFARSLTCV